MSETLIDIKELEKRWQLPRSWLYAQAAKGFLPHFKCGKYLRFKVSEAEAWLERHRRGGGKGHGSEQGL
jgi:predicted DNA-binding transcriptional regulator AlpA